MKQETEEEKNRRLEELLTQMQGIQWPAFPKVLLAEIQAAEEKAIMATSPAVTAKIVNITDEEK
jgi:hypothetical protein